MILLEDKGSVKKQYPKINENDFDRLISLDPTYNANSNTVGTYGKWILNLFNKGKLSNEGHVRDILKRFEENKNNLKNKDINSFKSLEELEDYLNSKENYNELSKRQKLRQTQKEIHSTNIVKEATLIYEDNKWEAWVPHTYEASCKLGRNSHWCTATTESSYYYNVYTEMGSLIIINSKTNPEEKYQIHIASNSFMNIDDVEPTDSQINNIGKDTLFSIIKNYFISQGVEDINIEYKILADFLTKGTDYSDKFYYWCLSGQGDSPFDYDNYTDISDYDIEDSMKAITEENWNSLKKYGITKENYEEVLQNQEDYEDISEVIYAIIYAIATGSASGAEADCWEDFDKTFKGALPEGIQVSYEEDVLNIKITDIDALSKGVIQEILSRIDYGDWDDEIPSGSYIEKWFLKCLSSNFDLVEPYSGWFGFDETAFNDDLSWRLYELDGED